MREWLFLPQAASSHAGEIDYMMVLLHWLVLILFIGWGAYFVYVLWRFRQSRQPRASYEGAKTHVSSYIEGGIVIAEAVLLVGFSIPLWFERVEAFPPPDQAITVRVVGEQFAWNVHYPGRDGIFGRVAPDLVDSELNPLGLDRSDPNAADDISTINQLHLPVDKPAIIHLSSKDVIHSFSLVEMRVKQDVIPGVNIPLWFVPTVTTAEMREIQGKEDFNYEISCAQLCGIGHYRMRGFLTVHTAEEFDQWLEDQASQQVDSEDDFWNQ